MTGDTLFLVSCAIWGGVIVVSALAALIVARWR